MKNLFSSALSAAALLWLTAVPVSGQESVLLSDINQQAPEPDESVKSLVNLNGLLIIAIDDPLTGAELWRSDGSPEGTILIADIIPGTVGSAPESLTVVGNRVFFTALSATGTRDLWVTDGSAAQTRLVKSFPGGQPPKQLKAFAGKLVFIGYDSTNGYELWQSDGTASGTKLVVNINPASGQDSSISEFLNVNDTFLYFTAFTTTTERELWRMNANFVASLYVESIAGPATIFPGGNAPVDTDSPHLTLAGGYVYFVGFTLANGREVYRTDGAGSLQLVRDIAPEALSSDPESLTSMFVGGTPYLYFVANNNSQGKELYRNTPVGQTNASQPQDPDATVLMRDLQSGAGGSEPRELTVFGNTLFFTADMGTGRALFRSNGLPGEANTSMVTNSLPGSDPHNLLAYEGVDEFKVLFTATDTGTLGLYGAAVTGDVNPTPLAQFEGVDASVSNMTVVLGATSAENRAYFLVNNSQLWVTDGVDAGGTSPVKNFQQGSAGSMAASFAVTNSGVAYFSANNGIAGRELWKTDGTDVGTEMVLDIQAGSVGSDPEFITAAGNKVFFSAEDLDDNRELWMSDGTSDGTVIVKTQGNTEINTGGGSEPEHITYMSNGYVYFSAVGTTTGREPWRSDGTIQNTKIIANLVNGSGDSAPEQFTQFRESVFFVSGADNQPVRLRSELTPMVPVQDPLTTNAGPLNPKNIVLMGTGANERMYFAAEISGRGRELWKTDGTSANTLCIDINTGANNSDPEFLTVVGNALYFVANGPSVTNPTTGAVTSTGRELWRSTGTLETTKLLKDIVPGATSSEPQDLIEAGGMLFFTANTAANGRELWVSKGTAGGTVMVKDIRVGTGSSGISDMKNVDGILVFSADDGINGREVWISDGTAKGTIMLENLGPQSAASNPSGFTAFKGQLLYTASAADVGNEPRQAFIGSNIEVYYENAQLAQNDMVAFDEEVNFKASDDIVLEIRNTGLNSLVGVKPVISGTNASEFKFIAPKASAIVPKDEVTTFGIRFTPKEGGPRVATLSIFSNDGDDNPFVIQLSAEGVKDPWVSTQPISLLRSVGENASFTATATASSGNLTTQWRKRSAKIKETEESGTSPLMTNYNLTSLTLKDAGAYSILVDSAAGKAVSNSAELGIVQDNLTVPTIVAGLGGTATLKVVAAGNFLEYQWMKDGQDIGVDGRMTGINGKTLVIRGVVGGDTGLYTCRVTNPSNDVRIGGTSQLNIFDSVPDVSNSQGMPFGIVGGEYSHQIVIDPSPAKAALSYSAQGLPPGVKLNAKTGLISGRPTKAGDYSVILTARNTLGFDVSSEQAVQIEDLPAGLANDYVGTVARNTTLNQNLGARFDLKVSTRGTFTGKLTIGATRVSIKGAVEVYRAEMGIRPKAVVQLKPAVKSGLPTMTLNLEFNTNTGLLNNTGAVNTVVSGVDTALITAWQRLSPDSVVQYIAGYNFALEVGDSANEDLPQGWGFASFKVAKNGNLKLAGRSADGEKITVATFLGRGQRILLYQGMYVKEKGSMMGTLLLNNEATANPADNTVSGIADWVRPEATSVKSRAYQAGFGLPDTSAAVTPVELEAVGSAYAKPEGLVLGLTNPPAEIEISFAGAGIPVAANTEVSVGEKNKLTQTSSITKLKPFNTSKGLFSGSIALDDGRKATFQGVLMKDGLDHVGMGYFLLAQPPESGETTKTSPVLSGSVLIEPSSSGLPPP